MSWDKSQRRSELPSDWPQRRRRVLQRDNHRCVLCGEKATDVDHIVRGDDHSLENLRALCSLHHRLKTSAEGHAAYWGAIKQHNKRFRRTEEHPGLL